MATNLVIFVRVSWANFVSLHSKGIIAQQETKQLFLSSRKYLFHSQTQIASTIDSVNQIFNEYDSSDIPACVSLFLDWLSHAARTVSTSEPF